MTLDNEFRVFVSNGTITAISQYDHYSVYPHLHPLRSKLELKIREAWAEAHERMKEKSYVIDLAYLPSMDKMIVIELSPFLPCTGAALFSWKVDGHLLRNGIVFLNCICLPMQFPDHNARPKQAHANFD